MKSEVNNYLLKIFRDFGDIREQLGIFMFRSNEPLSGEDYGKVRDIYDAICRVQDLI